MVMDNMETKRLFQLRLSNWFFNWAVIWGALLFCGSVSRAESGTNQPPASTTPSSAAYPFETLVWGKAADHWQLACLPDESAAVIHGYVRNLGPRYVPYPQEHLWGDWRHVSLMVRYGNDWLALDRKQGGFGLEIGTLPQTNSAIVKPYEILKPGIFGRELSFWRLRHQYDGPTARTLGTPLSAPAAPLSQPATFLVDLLDYEWPDYLLKQTSLPMRVSAFDHQSETFTVDVQLLRMDLACVKTKTPVINVRALIWDDHLNALRF
jgi:hypothetical protein